MLNEPFSIVKVRWAVIVIGYRVTMGGAPLNAKILPKDLAEKLAGAMNSAYALGYYQAMVEERRR